MDSTGIGNPKLLVLNPLRILARHHVDIMPNHQRISKMRLLSKAKHRRFSWCLIKKSSADVPQKKTGCTTWIVDPKTHFAFGCFDAISLWKVRKHDSFSATKKVSGVLEPDLNRRQFFEVFLEKLQPSYTFWCELNSEMIWKMTWYSYVTVKICIFR